MGLGLNRSVSGRMVMRVEMPFVESNGKCQIIYIIANSEGFSYIASLGLDMMEVEMKEI
jgi:hypothetical protein